MKKMACIFPKQKLSAVIFGLTLFLLCFTNVSFAKDITLTWDANQESNVAFYNVYSKDMETQETWQEQGPAHEPVASTISHQILGLDGMRQYCFQVTALNDSGIESSPSQEVCTKAADNNETNPSDPENPYNTLSAETGYQSVNHTWTTVPFKGLFEQPVVIVGPPTYHDSDPGVVRLNNVTTTSFALRFQEWDYLDGSHAQEDIPYLALEKGRYPMPNGTIVEVGSFTQGGTAAFSSQSFTGAFPGVPKLFLTLQTYNGAQAVTTRARNLTTTGFEAALFEQETLMDGHATETVGYLAIYSPQGSGSLKLAEQSVPYVLQSQFVNHQFVPVLSQTLKLEEENSLDDEIAHVDEAVDMLVLGDKLFAQNVNTAGGDTIALRRRAPEYSAAMEWGTVDGVDHTWKTIPLAKHYKNAVVVVKAVSSNGGDPGVIRTRNVSSDSFEVKYSEWSYLDGRHVPERLFYLVVEEGSHFLAGLEIMATNVLSNKLLEQGQWEAFVFDVPYDEAPAVFSSVSSTNGGDPITSRLHNVSVAGFSATMQEEQAKTDGHTTEILSVIVIEKGVGTTSDNRAVRVFDAATNDTGNTVEFGLTFSLRFPVVVGDMSSTFGTDPSVLRYKNLTRSSVVLSVQEEKSYDSETTHALEDISIFVAE